MEKQFLLLVQADLVLGAARCMSAAVHEDFNTGSYFTFSTISLGKYQHMVQNKILF